MTAMHWHAETRRLVLTDRRGRSWRVAGAGAVRQREPDPMFELVPHEDGTFTLAFGPLERRLSARPSEKPSGPGWIELDPMAVARIVFGRRRSRGLSLLRLVSKAGSAAAVIAQAGAAMQEALDQLDRTLHAGSRIVRR
ncbi:MAG: hypothetical protein ACF8XB_09750 [Planctomycetota bacterium JB042]